MVSTTIDFVRLQPDIVKVFDPNPNGEELSALKGLLSTREFNPDSPFTLVQAWLIYAVTDGRIAVTRPTPGYVIQLLTGNIIDNQGDQVSLKERRAYELHDQNSVAQPPHPVCQSTTWGGSIWYYCPLPVIDEEKWKVGVIGCLWRHEEVENGRRRFTYHIAFMSENYRQTFTKDVLPSSPGWKQTDYSNEWEINGIDIVEKVKPLPGTEKSYRVAFSLKE